MVKVGDTAILKSSNEEVFVLDVAEGPSAEMPGLGNLVTVRRPTGTQDGVKHLTEKFYAVEMETKDERLERELAERNMLRTKMGLDTPPGQIVERERPN